MVIRSMYWIDSACTGYVILHVGGPGGIFDWYKSMSRLEFPSLEEYVCRTQNTITGSTQAWWVGTESTMDLPSSMPRLLGISVSLNWREWLLKKAVTLSMMRSSRAASLSSSDLGSPASSSFSDMAGPEAPGASELTRRIPGRTSSSADLTALSRAVTSFVLRQGEGSADGLVQSSRSLMRRRGSADAALMPNRRRAKVAGDMTAEWWAAAAPGQAYVLPPPLRPPEHPFQEGTVFLSLEEPK